MSEGWSKWGQRPKPSSRRQKSEGRRLKPGVRVQERFNLEGPKLILAGDLGPIKRNSEGGGGLGSANESDQNIKLQQEMHERY